MATEETFFLALSLPLPVPPHPLGQGQGQGEGEVTSGGGPRMDSSTGSSTSPWRRPRRVSTVSTTKKYLCGGSWSAWVAPVASARGPGRPAQPSYLMMKSKLDPASMSRPSSVETAPSVTGANVCSRAQAARRFRLPWVVRKPCGDRGALWLLLGRPCPRLLICP